MKPSFRLLGPRGPFDDPFLFLRFLHSGRALLFDLGDIGPMAPRDLLRVTDVFVSHAHMDHFVGFDRLLRLHLHRSEVLNLYGPEGFIDRVEGRLRGFVWNLTQSYPLSLAVHEADGRTVRKSAFRAAKAFRREDLDLTGSDGVILDEGRFAVRAEVLDHGIPCLAFRLEERVKVNILSGALERRGLAQGRWLTALKDAVWRQEPPEKRFRVPGQTGTVTVTLGELEDVFEVTAGQAVAYIVDAADTPDNRRRIVNLAQKADVLYIEAAFAQGDEALAVERRHLTSRGAGELAAAARCARARILHLSPRYTGLEGEILEEARSAAGPDVAVEAGWRERPQ